VVCNKIYNKKFLLGDIHGHWGVILDKLDYLNEENICIIQVGDFGIGFDDIDKEFNRLSRLNDKLVELKSDLFVLRGNHDNPSWFKSSEFGVLKDKLTNIFFVPDYTVLNIDSENILFIGGAVSIDRVHRRINRMGWWADEVIKFDFERIKNIRDIDRIICHTAPDFCHPLKFNQLVYDFATKDDLLLKDLKEERANMTKLVTLLMKNNKLKGYYYGHFHSNYNFYHNGCEFIGIGVDKYINV
jgi:DNA repair exonuclease SbcCD nuclease subunit